MSKCKNNCHTCEVVLKIMTPNKVSVVFKVKYNCKIKNILKNGQLYPGPQRVKTFKIELKSSAECDKITEPLPLSITHRDPTAPSLKTSFLW